MQRIRLGSAFALAVLLAGCGQHLTASVAGGETHVITAPEYAVKGKTAYDQNWIDETTEAGIAGLGWHRPMPRPASFDAKPMPVKAPPMKPATFRERWLSLRRPVS